MNLEKLKELAVPVSERLPEIPKGEMIELWMIFKYGGGREELKKVILKNDVDFGIEVVDFLFHKNKTWEFHTHWVDFDLLTTKAKAIEFAKDAFKEGFHEAKTDENIYFDEYAVKHLEDFITENQNKL